MPTYYDPVAGWEAGLSSASKFNDIGIKAEEERRRAVEFENKQQQHKRLLDEQARADRIRSIEDEAAKAGLATVVDEPAWKVGSNTFANETDANIAAAGEFDPVTPESATRQVTKPGLGAAGRRKMVADKLAEAGYGKESEAARVQYETLLKEGVPQAAQAMKRGASGDEVLRIFNEHGDTRFKAVRELGKGVYEAVGADGTAVRLSGTEIERQLAPLKEQLGFTKTEQDIKQDAEKHPLEMQAKRAHIAVSSAALADRAETKAEKKALKAAVVGLADMAAAQQGITLTSAERDYVKASGAMPPRLAESGDFKIDMSEVDRALGEPVKDETGKPMVNEKTGMPLYQTTPEKRADFLDWMKRNRYTNSDKALRDYPGMKKPSSSAGAEQARNDARAAVARGMKKEEANKRLAAAGFQPI